MTGSRNPTDIMIRVEINARLPFSLTNQLKSIIVDEHIRGAAL